MLAFFASCWRLMFFLSAVCRSLVYFLFFFRVLCEMYDGCSISWRCIVVVIMNEGQRIRVGPSTNALKVFHLFCKRLLFFLLPLISPYQIKAYKHLTRLAIRRGVNSFGIGLV